MSYVASIHGSGALARALAIRLAVDAREAGEPALSLMVAWSEILELRRFAEQASTDWAFIERAEDQQIALGPMFGATQGVCFDCYVTRRIANGGVECRPATSATDAQLDVVVDVLCSSRAEAVSGRQVVIDPIGDVGTHLVLPQPNCTRCRAHPVMPLATPLDLVSRRVGVLHSVSVMPGPFPGLMSAHAVGSDTAGFSPAGSFCSGFAVGETAESATVRAVGEAIERYACAFYPEQAPLALGSQLDRPWIDPTLHGFLQTTDLVTTPIRWTLGRRVIDGEDVYIPASLVYLPFVPPTGEPFVDPQCSTGLAAGPSLAEVIEHGVCEVLERDLFMRAWRQHLPVEKVLRVPIDLPGLHVARIVSDIGMEVAVAFIEQDVPPYSAAGLAARPTLQDACRAATLEAASVYVSMREWVASDPKPPPYPPSNLLDHARVHAWFPRLRAARQRWLNPDRVAQQDEAVEGWLGAAGIEDASYVDLTTPDVAAAHLRVVRVVAPGRVRLEMDGRHPTLGGDRTPHPLA